MGYHGVIFPRTIGWRELEEKLRTKAARRIRQQEAAHRRRTEHACRQKPHEHAKQFELCGTSGYRARAHVSEVDIDDEVVEFDRYAGYHMHHEPVNEEDLYAE